MATETRPVETGSEVKNTKWLVVDAHGVCLGEVWSKDKKSALEFAESKYKTKIREVIYLK